MKPSASYILCEDIHTGEQYRIREHNINPDRSLLDNITGPDDERRIFLADGSHLLARNIRREIILEPNTYTPKKQRGGRS
ncbi:hypothetical protein AHN19_04120 [Salmonella enterica subsp. enterica]|nr:hypothetical protein [Salmonella enterica subsp. enterica]